MYFRKKIGEETYYTSVRNIIVLGKKNMITTTTRKEHSGECEWLIIPCMREAICIKLGNGITVVGGLEFVSWSCSSKMSDWIDWYCWDELKPLKVNLQVSVQGELWVV
jgi:hypothetical protein